MERGNGAAADDGVGGGGSAWRWRREAVAVALGFVGARRRDGLRRLKASAFKEGGRLDLGGHGPVSWLTFF